MMRKNTTSIKRIYSITCFVVFIKVLQAHFVSLILNSFPVCSANGFNLEIGYLSSQEKPQGETNLDILHAVKMAIDDINNNNLLLCNISISVHVKNIERNILESTKAFLELLENGAVTILGDRTGCSVHAAISSSWNLPIISHVCGEHELSNKKMFSTFSRTHPTDSQVVKSILALIQHFDWTQVSIIVENVQPWLGKAHLMTHLAKTNDFMITCSKYQFDNPTQCYFSRKECSFRSWCFDILERTKNVTTVYVFLGHLHHLITFLKTMEIMNMFKNNNHRVIYYDDEGHSYRSVEGTVGHLPEFSPLTSSNDPFHHLESDEDYWDDNWKARLEQAAKERVDGAESLSRQTVQSLLVVTVQLSVANYIKFSRRLRSSVFKATVYEDPPMPVIPEYFVSTYLGYAYDAVMLYALSLHETFRQSNITTEKDVSTAARDGSTIFKQIISRKIYNSIFGNTVSIDNNGDPELNFTVLIVTPTISDNRIFVSKKHSFPFPRMNSYGYFEKDAFGNMVFYSVGETNLSINVSSTKNPSCYNCGTFRSHDGDNLLEGHLTVLVVLGYIFIVATSLYILVSCLTDKRQRMKYFNVKLDTSNTCLQSDDNSSRHQMMHNYVSFNSKNIVTQNDLTSIRIKDLGFPEKRLIKHKTLKEIRLMSKIHNENINRFIGVIVEPRRIYLMTEHCSRGSLSDILADKTIKVDTVLVKSFVNDILCGLTHLTNTTLQCHGNLKSSNCVVTRNWVLQVTDFGLHELRQSSANNSSNENVDYERMLWKAPELLRHPSGAKRGTRKGDIYAFGILLHEIIGRKGPFGIYQSGFPMEIKGIVEKVKQGPTGIELPYRPQAQAVLDSENGCPHYVWNCMSQCWSENPDDRPSLIEVSKHLARMKKWRNDLVDEILETMVKYDSNLEDLVVERNRLLVDETQKIDDLLTRMYPKSVIADLTNSSKTVPEKWDSVTMVVIDIVDFTKLSSRTTPMGTLVLLDDVYTMFDSMVGGYAVSKMGTIGDAYVAASLPDHADENHVGEIASLALDVLAEVHKFKIPPREDPLLVRIGVHTGPAVTGLVGTVKPSYSIYGQTVSIASKMESTGKHLQIQISETSYAALKEVGGYVMEQRHLGNEDGNMKTYWLTGRTDSTTNSRIRCRGVAVPLCFRSSFKK